MTEEDVVGDSDKITRHRIYFLINQATVQTFGEMLDSVEMPDRKTGDSLGEKLVALMGYAWHAGTRELARHWQIVMLVTAVESYVQDIMKRCATVRPVLILDTEGERTVKLERLIKTADCRDVLVELVEDWSRRYVERGPRKWLYQWRDWGLVSGVSDQELEYLWARRNAVVHAGSQVTIDLAKRYPARNLEVGDLVPCSSDTVAADIGLAGVLVRDADLFLSRRFSLDL